MARADQCRRSNAAAARPVSPVVPVRLGFRPVQLLFDTVEGVVANTLLHLTAGYADTVKCAVPFDSSVAPA